MANLKDYATGIVLTAPSPMSSGTSLVLQSGQGTRFPAVPFYVTAHPPMEMPTIDNAEKIKVTAVSTDTLTIERAQGDTTAKNIDVGWIITNAVFLKDVKPVIVTVSTGATTAAKVGTTVDANYIPEAGDMLSVTFSSGMNVNNPTLNIDGSGAKNIRLGNVNVSTSFVSTASALTLPMWYDGTYYNIYGSLLNTNTTYSEVSTAEITNTASTTTRLISGRRAEDLMANEATKSRTLTGKTIDGGSNTLTVLAGTQLTGTVPIANGGTNASTASGARTNLGMGTMATKDGTGFQTLTVASTAPSSPATGDIWVDTSIVWSAFAADRSGALSFTTIGAKVPINNELYDIGSCFDPTNNRFIAQFDGIYLFNATIGFSLATSSGYVIYLRVNNTTNFVVLNNQHSSVGGWGIQVGGARQLKLTAGDYVEVFALTSPGATGAEARCTFEGHMVFPL